jgi:hypothetical protein
VIEGQKNADLLSICVMFVNVTLSYYPTLIKTTDCYWFSDIFVMGCTHSITTEYLEPEKTIGFIPLHVFEAPMHTCFTLLHVSDAPKTIGFTPLHTSEAPMHVCFTPLHVSDALKTIGFTPLNTSEVPMHVCFTPLHIAEVLYAIDFTVLNFTSIEM